MEGAIRMLATLSNPSGLKIGFITKVIFFLSVCHTTQYHYPTKDDSNR